MWSALFPSKNDRKLIPHGRLSGPMPWVIAIMIFLTILATATGLAVRSGASAVNADLAGRITIQIIEANPDIRAQQSDAVMAFLKADPSISKAVRVPDDDVSALLAPWIDGDSLNADIPIPALIDADLAPNAGKTAVDDLRAGVTQLAASARLDANASWLTPVFDLLNTLQWLALILVILLATATAAAVILSARSALNSHQETIKIIRLLGGTDQQVARLFQRRIALDAMFGGAVGLVSGLVVIVLFATLAGRLGSDLVSSASLGLGDWIIIALIPILGTILALVMARYTVMRDMAKTL